SDGSTVVRPRRRRRPLGDSRIARPPPPKLPRTAPTRTIGRRPRRRARRLIGRLIVADRVGRAGEELAPRANRKWQSAEALAPPTPRRQIRTRRTYRPEGS